jgi:hypothetical protein
MTYKEIVDRIKEVVDGHLMLSDFGYGNLSDIKANNEGNESADYPYAFLNPTNHSRSGQAVTYRFNLIVMDMVLDNDYLKIQSECQQYIDDILGNLRFGYNDQVDLTLNVTLTPFKERFQDEVAGMTATLEIVIPNRLSDCYEIVPPPPVPVVQAFSINDRIVRPEIEQAPLAFENVVIDDGGWRPGPSYNTYTNYYGQTESFKVVVTGKVTRQIETGEWPTVPDIVGNRIFTPIEPDIYDWPTDVAVGETVNWSATWNSIQLDNTRYLAVQFPNEPIVETTIVIPANCEIKIFKL